ncbi:phage integrase SAM-like domain-containing protein [Pseudomonas alliivorans]|nr:phage integrase SAM-like domain-containing protein [Pseudomonas alliivorans]MEE4873584.1 phage integrase SAM-like domain-containing protein [Pseudomonas alliivorans]
MKKKIFRKIAEEPSAKKSADPVAEAEEHESSEYYSISPIVKFERNASVYRSFDFGRWYGVGIDDITSVCQEQICRFLDKKDSNLATATVISYCRSGLRAFLDFIASQRKLQKHDITTRDINRNMVDGYLNYLKEKGLSKVGQRTKYNAIKSVLVALGRRGIIEYIQAGDESLFPRVPFTNINRTESVIPPLTESEKNRFASAVRRAVAPIWNDDVIINTHLLACALIVVALHTGRNTTPLLEMTRDCLHDHPKPGRKFLVLWKRRGYNTSKVVLRSIETPKESSSIFSVRNNVESLINRILYLTSDIAEKAPPHLRNRMWVCLSGATHNAGTIVSISTSNLHSAFAKISEESGLTDTAGLPLRVNISRLRKKFGNRIYEILNGDIAATAVALGNTIKVTGDNYLAPDENSKRNWRFMGELLVSELLSNTIGASYKDTPTGKCNISRSTEYQSERAGATCIQFINCVRCKHYAVTADDLYKVFSFYFRVYKEREHMNKKRWTKTLGHIPRLIDNFIINEGLKRSLFKKEDVDKARELARTCPHPYWATDALPSLDIIS